MADVPRTAPLLVTWAAVTVAAAGVAWFGVRGTVTTTLADPPALPIPAPHPLTRVPQVMPKVVVSTLRMPALPGRPGTAASPRDVPDRIGSAPPSRATGAPMSPVPAVPQPGPDPSGGTPTGSPTPSDSSAPIVVATLAPQGLVSPPTSPSPSAGPGDEIVRGVRADGGITILDYTPGVVTVLETDPDPGYTARSYQQAAGCVVVQFVSPKHTSTVYAYWTATGEPKVTVIEQDS